MNKHYHSHYENNNITKQKFLKIFQFIKFFAININKKSITEENKRLGVSKEPDVSYGLYGNNSLIHTFEGQNYSYHDTSKTAHATLEFRETKAIPNSIYTVAAFNKLEESISQASSF